jgi:hypothetical protein
VKRLLIFQTIDFLQTFADIIAAILNFLRPIVSPMGSWMVNWIDVVLNYFPFGDLMPYITAFVVILVIGAIVNILWPGDRPPLFVDKIKEKLKKAEKKSEEVDAKVEQGVEGVEAKIEKKVEEEEAIVKEEAEDEGVGSGRNS